MPYVRLGQVDYINCLPVYHALEEGLLDFEGQLEKGPPTMLNRMFLNGELDVTPISSIEYARNPDRCIILPDLSISADGRVESILLFSKIPITELEGKRAAVTMSSATSVVLLRILFEHYYHVQVELVHQLPHLETMLENNDCALLIGNDAMLAHQQVLEEGQSIYVTDLGEAWKDLSGEKMVYAIWVVRQELALKSPETVDYISNLLINSRNTGLQMTDDLIARAYRQTGLPRHILAGYFKTISNGFDRDYQRALLTYYDYAYKSGLIEERVKLNIWGE